MGYWEESNGLSRGWTDTRSAPSTPPPQPRWKRKKSPAPNVSPGFRDKYGPILEPEARSSGKAIPTYIIPRYRDGRSFSVHHTSDFNPRVDAKLIEVKPIPYPVPLSPSLVETWDGYVEAYDHATDIQNISAHDVEADCDYHICHSPTYKKAKRLRLEIDDDDEGRALERFADPEESEHFVQNPVDTPSVHQRGQVRGARRRLKAELSGYELWKRAGDNCKVRNLVGKVLHKRGFERTKHLEDPFVTTSLAEAGEEQEEIVQDWDAVDADFDKNGVEVKAAVLDSSDKDGMGAAGEESSDDHDSILGVQSEASVAGTDQANGSAEGRTAPSA